MASGSQSMGDSAGSTAGVQESGCSTNDIVTRAEGDQMPLNIDILLEIMSKIDDRTTLLNTMRTCQSLYYRGVPLLFKQGIPMCDIHLQSFCSFMLRDPSRLHFLREVGFGLFFMEAQWATPKLAERFATVLRNASNLRKLSLHSSVSKRGDLIGQAIASLERIEEITVDGFSREGMRMLEAMKSPVRKVSVSFHSTFRSDVQHNFVHALSSMRDSLEDVTVKYATWPAGFESTIRYPKVTSLTIVDSLQVDISGLVFAFPNLRDLHVRFEHERSDEWQVGPDTARTQNLARQQHLSWPSLRLIDASLMHVYIMAPSCPINHMELDILFFSRSPTQLVWYRDVLALAQPTSLGFVYITPDQPEWAFDDISKPIPASVKKLILGVDYLPGQRPVAALADALLKALRAHTSLTYLSFRLAWKSLRLQRLYGQESTDSALLEANKSRVLHPDLPYMQDRSLESIAEQFAAGLPSLKFITITFHASGLSEPRTGSWEVMRDGCKVSLREVEGGRDITDL